ncbi:FadR/GntR family transcriptional regulator [Actinomadura kijaniata]|uniref:FadR/GntR family transcriptional regulator n=1 Tax=Actinomadura kijaniata TaxID=46161 RepID=UPI001C3F2BDF|nr:FCD domain-containing protein [Actinomadura kijaniata]
MTAGPAYAALAADLRRRILAGEYRPGDRLPVEPEMCARYGVSRSTVREALRLLASQHLVTTVRGVAGGTFVAHPRPEQLSEHLATGLGLLAGTAQVSVDQLLEIRELLEVPAAGLAATRRDEADLAALRAALFDPAAVDPAEIYEPNRHFHAVLLRAAGNPLLEVVARPVFGVLNERFLRENAPPRFWHRVDADHREILARVEAGDERGARAAARAHLGHLRSTYLSIDSADRAEG